MLMRSGPGVLQFIVPGSYGLENVKGGVCERKDTRGQQVSASAGCAASRSSCQQVLSSYQHPRPLHPEEAPPSLPVTEVSPAGRGLGGAYCFASATTSLPLPGPNLAETSHLTYFPCALSCERPCYPGGASLLPWRRIPHSPPQAGPRWEQMYKVILLVLGLVPESSTT